MSIASLAASFSKPWCSEGPHHDLKRLSEDHAYSKGGQLLETGCLAGNCNVLVDRAVHSICRMAMTRFIARGSRGEHLRVLCEAQPPAKSALRSLFALSEQGNACPLAAEKGRSCCEHGCTSAMQKANSH